MAAIATLQSLRVFQPQFLLKFYPPLESTTRYFGTAEEFMSKSFESEKSVGILSLIGNLHQPLRKLFKLLDFP